MSGICMRSDFVECHLAVMLWKIFAPLFLVVGIPGNIVSIAVLSRQRMRNTTTSVYLRLLAIVDTAVILVAMPRQIDYYYSAVKVHDLSVFACKFFSFLTPTILTLSWCFLPILTIDRLILVRYPIWAKKHCTKKSALVVFAVLALAMITINFHQLVFIDIPREDVTGSTNLANTTVQVYGICRAVPDWYKEFYQKTWPLVMLVVFSLTPVILQIVCNVLLIRELAIRSRKRQTNRALQDKNDREQHDLRSVTRMLVVVSVFFVLSSVPQCIQLVLKPYVFKPKTAHNNAKNVLFKALIQLLMYSNNTINFLLYTLSGRVFRNELRSMFKQVKRRFLQCFDRNVIYPDETITTGQEQIPTDKKPNDAFATGSVQTKTTIYDSSV